MTDGIMTKSKSTMRCHVCDRVKIRRSGYPATKPKKEGFWKVSICNKCKTLYVCETCFVTVENRVFCLPCFNSGEGLNIENPPNILYF